MMTDKTREQFEHWYSDEGAYPKAIERKRADFGPYVLMGAQLAWLAWRSAWKASRAQALEEAAKACAGIERKKWEAFRDGGYLDGTGPMDCYKAIRALVEDSKEGSKA